MKGDGRVGWIVGLSIGMGALLGALWSMPPEPVRIFLNDAAAAAWTQAIGTLLALVVAIVVPWYVHDREIKHANARDVERLQLEAKAAQLKARAIAIKISSDVVWLATQVGYAENVNSSYLRLVKRFELPDGHIEDVVSIPKSILQSVDELHLAGPYAYQLQRAIALLVQIPEMVDRARRAIDPSKLPPRLQHNGLKLTMRMICQDLASYLDWTVQEFYQGEGSNALYEA